MRKVNYTIIGFLLLILFAGCENKQYYLFDGYTQGTTYHITIKDYENNVKAREIDSVLVAFSKEFSTYDSTSVVSLINYNKGNVVIDESFQYLMKVSGEVYKMSDGGFDVTVGPLVNAWGFGFKTSQFPDSAKIDSLRNFIGFDKVHVANNQIVKDNPAIILDFNAIAQGYSVDVMAKYLDGRGINNYLVEIGGELRAKGVNKEKLPWKVGVDKPIDDTNEENRQLQAIIKISDKSLATSGNYRKFFVENGIKYSHTIDPKTGFPAKNDLLSVTVIADECIYADAYATAFMVMGFEKSKQFVESHKELEAFFIYKDKTGIMQEYVTPGIDISEVK